MDGADEAHCSEILTLKSECSKNQKNGSEKLSEFYCYESMVTTKLIS